MATGVMVFGLVSCGNREQEARSELSAKSFTFTIDEFMRAARQGDVAALKHFREAGMEVDVTDGEGMTALFRAAQAGQAEAVAYLASQGANVEATGASFDTPLVAAARTGTLETVKALLNAKADPKVRTARHSWTALTAATYRGDVGIVNLLAPLSGGSLDEALQIASLQGKPAVVDALLRHGADVFSRSKDNKTPLMYAAAHGHADVVRLLMLNGSNKLLFDNDKLTAADLALAAGHADILAVLDDPKNMPPAPVDGSAGELVASEQSVTEAAAEGGVPAEGVAADASALAATVDGAVPGEIPTEPGATVAGVSPVAHDGPAAVDPELAMEVEAAAPFESPTGEDMTAAVGGGAAGLVAGGPRRALPRQAPRLQGGKLPGVSDGSTVALKETVRVREFREGQLPIVLEEVPAVGSSARIRVLGAAGSAPEIVPAGGAIGDTGLELVRVERKFMNSKMGEGHLLDVSHAVVRERATGRRHIVKRNQAAPSSQATALISAGSGDEVYEVQEGDEFTVGEDQPARYRVLDVRPTQVVVENIETGETATLARGYAQ
jgi:ankyrin repeat protein